MTFDDMVVTDSITINAPADVVYDVVSDVTRVGEWSPETRTADWIEQGARFTGTNKTERFEWTTTCVITAAERGRRFAFDVIGGEDGNGATWSWELSEDGAVTTLAQRFELGPSLGGFRGFGRGMNEAQIDDFVRNRMGELQAAMASSLANVKRLAELVR